MRTTPPPYDKQDAPGPANAGTRARANMAHGASAEDSGVYPRELASAAVQSSVPVLSRVPEYFLLMSGLALTSGGIHVVAFAEHVGENWLLGAFFGLVGLAQLVAACWIFRKPEDMRMLKLVAAGSVTVSLLWVLSRTTGIAFGPAPGRTSVGVADTITTLQQLALAAIVVVLLRRPHTGERRLAWLSGPVAGRLTFALLSTTTLLAALGGHEH